MKQNKTQKTNESVHLFLSSVAEEQKREDSYTLLNIIGEITQAEPHLWGKVLLVLGNIITNTKRVVKVIGFWWASPPENKL